MKKLNKCCVALVLSGLLLLGSALASGLTAGDSVITLSYLEQTYIPEVVEQGYIRIAEKLQETFRAWSGELDQVGDEYLHQVGVGEAGGYSASYTRRTYSIFDAITMGTGSGIILEAGRVYVEHGGTLVNVTTGETVPSGSLLVRGNRYMVAEDTQAVFLVESDAARVAVEGTFLVEQSGMESSPFTDITIYDDYRDAVNEVYDRGLFAGTGDGSIFAPQQQLNRAMMMTVLFHVAGDPDDERFDAKSTFTDVAAGEWYASYVSWAGEQGISAGYGDGSFKPLETLTQRHIVQFLFNFATSYLGLELPERADLSGFKKVNLLSDWGYEAMAWAVAKGIVETMDPNSQPTRGEVAVIMANFANSYF